MRLNILAFAAGIVCLQMQPELPAWEAWLAGGLLLLAGQRVRRNAATRGLAIVACLAIGFAFAAWRADVARIDAVLAPFTGARRG